MSAGVVAWFTGLSGSGKSTICRVVQDELLLCGRDRVEILDGDDLRKNITRGLGYSKADRDENVHRIGYVAHLLSRNGVIVLVAAISPYRDTREEVYAILGNVIEVYVSAPLTICECRDPKGLYAKARSGELWSFTGIDDPYEPPLSPTVECRTDEESIEESRSKVIQAILKFYSRSILTEKMEQR